MLSQPRFPSIAICILFCIWVTNPKPGNAQGFLAPVTYPVNITPAAVITEDLNHDSYCDVIIPNETSNSLTIMLANPDGTLQSPSDFPLGDSTLGAAVDDFDLDGNPDIASAGANGITIMRGDGNGAFAILSHIENIYALYPVATGDFNNDGAPDIATGTHINGPIYVSLNNGNGTFQDPTPYPAFAGGRQVRDLVCAHMDSDANLDILGCYKQYSSQSVIVLFKGNGDGTFQTPPLSAAPGGPPSNIITGHFSSSATTETLAALRGFPGDLVRIDFAATPPSVISNVYGGDGGYDLCSADFNGDSAADIAIAANTTVIVKINDPFNPGIFQNTSFTTLPGAGNYIQFIDSGDINGDGNPDLVSASYGMQTVSVLLNDYPTDSQVAGWALY